MPRGPENGAARWAVGTRQRTDTTGSYGRPLTAWTRHVAPVRRRRRSLLAVHGERAVVLPHLDLRDGDAAAVAGLQAAARLHVEEAGEVLGGRVDLRERRDLVDVPVVERLAELGDDRLRPWIDAEAFAAKMNGLGLEGVCFRPVIFEPTFHKHAKQACGGCQIHVTDRTRFRPVLSGVALLGGFHDSAPDKFAWRQPPYEYEHDKMPIDILAASSQLRTQIEGGVPFTVIGAGWEEGVREFERIRRGVLIY